MARDEWVTVYMTPKEKKRIQTYAEDIGLGLSTALRTLALKQLREEERDDARP